MNNQQIENTLVVRLEIPRFWEDCPPVWRNMIMEIKSKHPESWNVGGNQFVINQYLRENHNGRWYRSVAVDESGYIEFDTEMDYHWFLLRYC